MAFDTVRGLLMVVTMAAHVLPNLASTLLLRPALQLFRAGVVGTAGFVTLSGLVVGYVLSSRPREHARVVVRYRRQALRLLLIAHPLIVVAIYSWKRHGGMPPNLGLRLWFITDSLAVLFLVMVPLVARVRGRLWMGAALLVAGRLLSVLRPAGPGALVLLLDILVGPESVGRHVLYEDYPLLPLSGMFLVGAAFGPGFSEAEQNDRLDQQGRKLLLAAPVALLLSAVMLGAWAILRQGPHGVLRAVLYPDYGLSTYPVYLAAVLGLTGWLLRSHAASAVESFLALLGRTALFVYVIQYYFTQFLPQLLGLRAHMRPLLLVSYFALVLLVLKPICQLYERLRDRRWTAPPPSLSQPMPR